MRRKYPQDSSFSHSRYEERGKPDLQWIDNFMLNSPSHLWKGEDNFAYLHYEDQNEYLSMVVTMLGNQFIIVVGDDKEYVAVTPTAESRPILIEPGDRLLMWSNQWMVDRVQAQRAVHSFLESGNRVDSVSWARMSDDSMVYLMGGSEEVVAWRKKYNTSIRAPALVG